MAYAVTESYQWYKGADATTWGVSKSIEGAKKILRESIEELYSDFFLDMDEDEIEDFIQSRFVEGTGNIVFWVDEDDDAVRKFYIDEVVIDE